MVHRLMPLLWFLTDLGYFAHLNLWPDEKNQRKTAKWHRFMASDAWIWIWHHWKPLFRHKYKILDKNNKRAPEVSFFDPWNTQGLSPQNFPRVKYCCFRCLSIHHWKPLFRHKYQIFDKNNKWAPKESFFLPLESRNVTFPPLGSCNFM